MKFVVARTRTTVQVEFYEVEAVCANWATGGELGKLVAILPKDSRLTNGDAVQYAEKADEAWMQRVAQGRQWERPLAGENSD